MIVNTDPRHSEAERIALETVAGPLNEDERAWESVHTGGGCMAWETVCDDNAARIWICDLGNGLGDAETDCWLVGLHPYAEWNDHWQDEAKTLQEALNLATLAQAARAFALGFNPHAPLNFAEFVASARAVADLGAYAEFEDEAGNAGRVYHGNAYLRLVGGQWSLIIGNREWLAVAYSELERRLYDFAASEGYLMRPATPLTPVGAPLWRDQFPTYPEGDMPAIPAGWEDTSWHNDICPSFKAPGNLQIFVDFADAEQREYRESARFSVNRMADDGVHVEPECDALLVSDDWQAVLDFVAAYVPPAKAEAPAASPMSPADELAAVKAELAAQYVKRIGYDPFEDCPSISPAEVARTLIEHADENARAALECAAERIAEETAEIIASVRKSAGL